MQGHKNDSFNPKRKSFNCQVNNAIRKYKWENVKKEIILTCDILEIDDFEKQYIKLLNSSDRKLGYNRESGGNKNKAVSEKTKELISKLRTGKPQWGVSVLQIDPITNQIIKEWFSMREAGKNLKVSHSSISLACSGKLRMCKIKGKEYFTHYKQAGGFKWALNPKALMVA
jgi:hypothetical protein